MNDRPRDIPNLRGFSPESATRDPDRPYSAASYAAQYGITVDEAEELRDEYATDKYTKGHPEIVAAIQQLLLRSPGRLRLAIQGEGTYPHPSDTGPLVDQAGDFQTAGKVMADAGMLRVGDAQPGRKYKERSTVEAFKDLAESLAYSDELQAWLDKCMARGDHNLGDDTFRWDDIPKEAQPKLRRMLAMRYIEAKLDEGNPAIVRLLSSQQK